MKVLHINAGSKNWGGVSAFCLNLYRNIDRSQIQFDFLTPNITTYEEYRNEIESFGGRIFQLNINASSMPGKMKLIFGLKRFFSKEQYDIIHINSGVLLFNCIVAKACRRYTKSKIIVHSHNNGGRSNLKEMFSSPLKLWLEFNADALLACSKSAAEYMFTNRSASHATIVNNGIHVGEFRFDEAVRLENREKLQLQDKFVIGHIGRFTPQKNHQFLIELMKEIKKKKDNAVLIMIGQGELLDEMNKKTQEEGLSDCVRFLGQRKDVAALYQAMDVFVLPSLFEGFGIVNLEAQVAGLKCVVSDVVPKEVNVTGNVIRLSLDADKAKWVREIIAVPEQRISGEKPIRDAGFDIQHSAKIVEKLYHRLIHEKH